MWSASSRRWLAPEVIQTSAMDCGPAALKCLLDGFGRTASYGRLREACQTDVDGTSIDTLEEIAKQLGLSAEQVILPKDHVLLPESAALPAIIVVELANGFTHFIVVWRRHGSLIQVMDPAVGRRWISASRLLDEVYVHVAPIRVSAFRAWASSEEILAAFRRRAQTIGCGARVMDPLIGTALADEGWHSLAALDAALRMVTTVVEGDGLRRGGEAETVLRSSFESACKSKGEGKDDKAIPESYWTARADPDGEGNVLLRGAILVKIGDLQMAMMKTSISRLSKSSLPS